jgi:hypothetical protein
MNPQRFSKTMNIIFPLIVLQREPTLPKIIRFFALWPVQVIQIDIICFVSLLDYCHNAYFYTTAEKSFFSHTL